jgi:hypothetical protein
MLVTLIEFDSLTLSTESMAVGAAKTTSCICLREDMMRKDDESTSDFLGLYSLRDDHEVGDLTWNGDVA